MEQFLSVKEAAARSGPSEAYIRHLATRGLILARKPHHEWGSMAKSLDDYQGNLQKPGSN